MSENGVLSKKVALFCIGNYYMGDDGFAVHLMRDIEDSFLSGYLELFNFGAVGLGILDYILPYRKLIIVDALQGTGKPGDISKFDLSVSHQLLLTRDIISAHDLGIIESIEIVKRLYPERQPGAIILIGVEALAIDKQVTSLSPQLKKALPIVKQMVFQELAVEINPPSR